MKQQGADRPSALSAVAGVIAALTLLLDPLALPLAAADKLESIDYAAEAAAIARFQDHDQRLQDVGWQLVRGNVGFCDSVIPSIGLQLQDMASYGRPDIARKVLQLRGDFAVQTAARSSPAELSGDFARNREIVRLGRFNPNEWPAGKQMAWQRVATAHDHIDALLVEHGGIEVGFADGGAAKVQPVEVCAGRFELMGEGAIAVADGKRVVIGIDFPAFAYDDAMFAALLAHELAHNLLGHDAWLDRNGRSAGKVKRTEREADRLIPWLLANAGYDPRAAVRFMEEWGSRHTVKTMRPPTHDTWPKRARAIAQELPLVAGARRAGRADWSRHFRREIDPARGL